MEAAYGVAAWSSPAWIAGAVAWLDERLAAAGRERTGAVEQTRVRPWSTLIRAPTAGGDVWFKAAGPATAFETALVPLGADPGPYLDGFGDRAALREEAELARRVATIARVLTWERALRSAWEQGEALDERWTSAPAETLATLL